MKMPEATRAKAVDDLPIRDTVVDQEATIRLLLPDVVELVDVRARVIAHGDTQVLGGVPIRHLADMPVVPFDAVLQGVLGVGEEGPVEPGYRHVLVEVVRQIIDLALLGDR